jgi:predicted Rossmann fold flavoprotein
LDQHYDLIIVGGGASGVLAALGAREAGLRGALAIVEKESQALRKVLASGNGRCNIASLEPVEGHYRGGDPDFVRPVFQRLPAEKILAILRDLGLMTMEERERRVYPRSLQARSVTLLLLNALQNRQVALIQPLKIEQVKKQKNHFLALADDGTSATARSVLVAAGSCASPDLGGSRSGYEILQGLGHRLNEPVPSLVPLTLSPHPLIQYAEGVRFRGSVSFKGTRGAAARTSGEYLITKYGLSGIAAMELGGAVGHSVSSAATAGVIEIDFLPELEEEAIGEILAASDVAHDDWRIALAGLVPDKIARALVGCAASHGQAVSSRSGMIRELSRQLKHLQVGVTGTRGFSFAQVASGGIATDDFDPDTLMSRLVPGLFACGEVLDIDGDTGGFNLMWAMASGWLAGQSAAVFLESESS